MTRALVASFGFDEKFVVRAVIRHGVGSGDEIILVTGKAVEKTMQAMETIKKIAETVEAKVELVELGEDVYNFPKLVSRCKRLLEELTQRHDTITVLLSGGMRVIVLGLYTATLTLPPDIKDRIHVEIDTEDVGKLVKVPNELIKLLTPPELGAKQELLRLLVEQPGLTVEEIAAKLGKDVSTVRRQVQALAALGLVRVEGRPQRVKPVEAALAIL